MALTTRRSLGQAVLAAASFVLLLLLAGLLACGGGRTAVVGLGNSGNRIIEADEVAEELAEILAESPVTPEISDELMREVFDAIVARARDGDIEAAAVVMRVAVEQRAPAEEG